MKQALEKIIKTIQDHGNVSLYEDFVDVALNIPAEDATWIVELVDDWLNNNVHLRLPMKLGAYRFTHQF